MQSCESVPLRYEVDSVHQVLTEGYGLRNTKHHLFVCYIRPWPAYYITSPQAWGPGTGFRRSFPERASSQFRGFANAALSVFASLPTYQTPTHPSRPISRLANPSPLGSANCPLFEPASKLKQVYQSTYHSVCSNHLFLCLFHQKTKYFSRAGVVHLQ